MARSLSLACALAVACLGLLACCEAVYPVAKVVSPHYAVYDPHTHYNKHCTTKNFKVIDDIFEPRYSGYWPYPAYGYHGYSSHYYGYPAYGHHGYGSHYYGYPAHGHHGYGSHYHGYPAVKSGAW